MTDRNETVADIVAELRQKSYDAIACGMQGYSDKLDDLAYRIEAAAKREELRWAKANGELARMLDCEKAQGGNAAAMREAAEHAIAVTDKCSSCRHVNTDYCDTCDNFGSGWYDDLKAALSAPPRNCDKPEFATPEKALEALKARFPVEEWISGFKVAAEWLLDSADFCLVVPVSRRFGSSQEGGK